MLRGVPAVWCPVCTLLMVGTVLGVFAVLTAHAGATTVVRTQAYYVQALSDIGGHRRMVRTRSRPETYVTFVTVGGSQLEYRASTDLGKTWHGGRKTRLGPSLQGGISTWIDEQDNIYVLYDDSRNTLTCRKLTYQGNAKWTIGERMNGGRSLAQFRAYFHSAVVKEPGRNGNLWTAWWEHGRKGKEHGTIKRIHVRRSTDPDGKGPWSKPMDPLPSKVRAIENETLAVTFLLLDGKPALFIYQGFYGTTGVSRWNGTQWVFEAIDLKAGLTRPGLARFATCSITQDSKGGVHLVWNAQHAEGSIFYKRMTNGRWGKTTVLSKKPRDRWPTVTVTPADEPVVIWCHPVEATETFTLPHEVVCRRMRDGKWNDPRVIITDHPPQEGKSIMFPNTSMTSGSKVVFIYSYGPTVSRGLARELRSGVLSKGAGGPRGTPTVAGGVLDLIQGHAYDCFDIFVRYGGKR